MNSYYGIKFLHGSLISPQVWIIYNMQYVQVSFRAQAGIYQKAIERDMEFHEQAEQLEDLRILIEPVTVRIDITNDICGWLGNGSADAPYLLDNEPPVPPPSPNAEPICVICQDSLGHQSHTLPCGHVYHQCCIRGWFNQRSGRKWRGRDVVKGCPLCGKYFRRVDVY